MLSRMFLNLGLVRRSEPVRDQHARKRRADLGRVDAAGDQNDGLARRESVQLLCDRGSASAQAFADQQADPESLCTLRVGQGSPAR